MNVDFAILGSTPLAAVLAGMLSKQHGRDVCWAGAFAHTLRPQRGFDMSVAPLTRPETWRLLKECTPQLVEALDGLEVTEHVDPLFIAKHQYGADVLSHMNNVAAGYGYAMERQAISDDFASAFQFRDAIRFLRRPFAEALPNWLAESGVHTIPTNNLKLQAKKTGLIHIEGDIDEPIVAKHVVLADDDAIIRHIKPQNVSAYFHAISTIGYLVEPVGEMKSSVIHDVDTGMTIYQRNNGALDCVAPGLSKNLEPEICGHIGGTHSARLAGKTTFDVLHTKEGAALIGELRPTKAIVIAGFGATGLFQTPAIARLLAGTATEFETSYFTQRSTNQHPEFRLSVSEFQPFCASGLAP